MLLLHWEDREPCAQLPSPCLGTQTLVHPETPHFCVQTIRVCNVIVIKIGLQVPLNQVLGSLSPAREAD